MGVEFFGVNASAGEPEADGVLGMVKEFGGGCDGQSRGDSGQDERDRCRRGL